MRPRTWRRVPPILTVLATLLTGCYAAHRFADPQPTPTGVIEMIPAPGSGTLPDGVQITTDPNPHRRGTYRVPEWDSQTTEIAGTVTTVVIHAIVASQVVRVFGG